MSQPPQAALAEALVPVLRRWRWVIGELAREWLPTQCPWWDNERSLVGTLAAATWLEKGQAFEEYVITRGRKKPRPGRCDLDMKLPAGQRCVVEAKIEWSPAWDFDDAVAGVETQLKRACAQARTVNDDPEPDHYLGAVFVVPMLRTRSLESDWRDLAAWRKRLADDIDVVAQSEFVVRQVRQAPIFKPERRAYPGVAVLLRDAHQPPSVAG